MHNNIQLERIRHISVTLFAIVQRFVVAKHKVCIFGAIYAALSIFVMAHFLSSSHLGDVYHRTAYDAMYEGNAWKPFVYRVLIPKMTQIVVEATPETWQQPINKSVKEWMRDPKTLETRRLLPWIGPTFNKKTSYPRIVTTLIIYAMLWGYIIMLFKLAKELMPDDTALRWFAPIFGLLAISAFSRPWQYIYDIPVLYLSASCYYFIIRKQYKAYILFFVLACLNRETAIFIFIFFTLWAYKQYNTLAFVSLWVTQCVVFISIKSVLALIYYKNPGWFLEENLFFVLNKDILGKANFHKMINLGMLFFLLTYRWKMKPAFLKTGLWLLPAVYTAYVFHGNPGEYRVFFDVLPVLVLLATHTLTQAAGFAQTPFFQMDSQIRASHDSSDTHTPAKAVD